MEARRRGYDIEALPKGSSIMQDQLARNRTLAWIDPETGAHPVTERCGCRNAKELSEYLQANIKEGERYAFAFNRTNSGHIVTAEMIDGVPTIYDPQSNRTITDFEAYAKMQIIRYTAYAMDFSPVLMRIDNLDFAPDVLEKIAKAK